MSGSALSIYLDGRWWNSGVDQWWSVAWAAVFYPNQAMPSIHGNPHTGVVALVRRPALVSR